MGGAVGGRETGLFRDGRHGTPWLHKAADEADLICLQMKYISFVFFTVFEQPRHGALNAGSRLNVHTHAADPRCSPE